MKVLICMPHWERWNRGYLLRVLQEYNYIQKSGEFDLDIRLFTTQDIKFPFYNLKIRNHLFNKEVYYCLTREHRKVMEELRNDYDLYMYFEDDVLITIENLRYFLRQLDRIKRKGLSFRFVPGFHEYEDRGDNLVEKQLIAQHSGTPFIGRDENDPKFHDFFMDSYNLVLSLIDEEYFELACPVQGGFIITKEQLNWILDNKYHEFYTVDFQGVPESAASDVFVKCGLKRILSRFDWQDSLVHHLRNWLWSIGWVPIVGIKELLYLVDKLYDKHGYPAGNWDYWR